MMFNSSGEFNVIEQTVFALTEFCANNRVARMVANARKILEKRREVFMGSDFP
jgi:hypothetical protein